MTKPVKDEIFGTRKSLLKDKLLKFENNIKIFENIFFATCLRKYNSDPKSRYIILYECRSENEIDNNSLKYILPFLKDYIRVINIFISQEKVIIKNIRNDCKRVFSDKIEAAKYILKMTNCLKGELINSKANIRHDGEISELSKFLRLNMYGRLGSTDVDFFIFNLHTNTLILVEEKTFVEDKGGSIGHGQYISFRELILEGLNIEKNYIKFYLLFVSNTDNKNCYYYDFLKERYMNQRKPSYYDKKRREKRVIINFSEMKFSSLDEFIKLLVEDELV